MQEGASNRGEALARRKDRVPGNEFRGDTEGPRYRPSRVELDLYDGVEDREGDTQSVRIQCTQA